jgi:hypothetical protein
MLAHIFFWTSFNIKELSKDGKEVEIVCPVCGEDVKRVRC